MHHVSSHTEGLVYRSSCRLAIGTSRGYVTEMSDGVIKILSWKEFARNNDVHIMTWPMRYLGSDIADMALAMVNTKSTLPVDMWYDVDEYHRVGESDATDSGDWYVDATSLSVLTLLAFNFVAFVAIWKKFA